LAFYFAASAMTRLREDLKDLDDAFKAGGGRDYKQVDLFSWHVPFS
jgi:hypothetical protein